MSNINILNPDKTFGFTLQFRENGQSRDMQFGRVAGAQLELVINFQPSESLPEESKYKFSIREYCQNTNAEENKYIPKNTLIIRFTESLLSVLFFKKSIDANLPELSFFNEGFFIENAFADKSLPKKYSNILSDIIGRFKGSILAKDGLCSNIYKLSELLFDLNLNVKRLKSQLYEQLSGIIDYVVANGYSFPSAKTFLKIIGCPRVTFVKKIKKISDRPFIYFLSKIKANSCLKEILFTEKQFKDIAYTHGYADQSSFNRRIKLDFGLSPKEIRKMAKVNFVNFLIG